MSRTAVMNPQDYFTALRRKLDRSPVHRCAGCGVADGCRYYSKEGKPRGFALVRLALVDPNSGADDPANVDLFCLRCRPGIGGIGRASKVLACKIEAQFALWEENGGMATGRSARKPRRRKG